MIQYSLGDKISQKEEDMNENELYELYEDDPALAVELHPEAFTEAAKENYKKEVI